jgi:sterol 3beta-glucosyltransferase
VGAVSNGRKIAITTLGTRGDVQPYLALAQALGARGHEVTVLGPEQFVSLADEHGVRFAPLPGDIIALIDTAEAKKAVAGSEGFAGGFKLLKYMRPLQDAYLEAEAAAMREIAPDMIIYHPKSLGAPHIAEALGTPTIFAAPLPGFTPTAAFPTPVLPFRSLGPLNRASHKLMMNGAYAIFGKALRAWREKTLGLPARGKGRTPLGTIYAYSPHVLPRPADWGDDVLVSGYWFVAPPQWTMPDDLAVFLADGDAPVYIGFGSMPGFDPEHVTAVVVEALTRTGKRGLLATGGGALAAGDVPGHVHVISGAPHQLLFPHVSATVHHGGAGTTGAALRAGKPTTICPHFGDQPFWGRVINELGVGPEPISKKAFSVESLSAALIAMDDTDMRRRAAAIGEAIRAEDGLTAAADFIENRLG